MVYPLKSILYEVWLFGHYEGFEIGSQRVKEKPEVSERFARRVLGQHRSTERKIWTEMPPFNIIDGFTRECLAIGIDRMLNSTAVIDIPSSLFILWARGPATAPGLIVRAVQD